MLAATCPTHPKCICDILQQHTCICTMTMIHLWETSRCLEPGQTYWNKCDKCDKWPVLHLASPFIWRNFGWGKKYTLGIWGGTGSLAQVGSSKVYNLNRFPCLNGRRKACKQPEKDQGIDFTATFPYNLNFVVYLKTWAMFICLILTCLVKLELSGSCVLKLGY